MLTILDNSDTPNLLLSPRIKRWTWFWIFCLYNETSVYSHLTITVLYHLDSVIFFTMTAFSVTRHFNAGDAHVIPAVLISIVSVQIKDLNPLQTNRHVGAWLCNWVHEIVDPFLDVMSVCQVGVYSQCYSWMNTVSEDRKYYPVSRLYCHTNKQL